MSASQPSEPVWLQPSAEVAEAVRRRGPVVALESTVIAHGLPWPRNLETALELEETVRARGAIPATVAILDGVARIGLERAEIEAIARDPAVEKVSTRDLSVVLARRRPGATTVAATIHLARLAGIDVFATGGIGGVHRRSPPDLSADLLELHRTPIVVVCAGAKSILDLPATREALETLGVLVLGYRTDRFPAFYSPGSSLGVDARVDEAADVGRIWREHARIGARCAILLCVPVPAAAAIEEERVEKAIAGALREAGETGIRGREITPFLLKAVAGATGGESLNANVALLRNNAVVAADVAIEIAGAAP